MSSLLSSQSLRAVCKSGMVVIQGAINIERPSYLTGLIKTGVTNASVVLVAHGSLF